ncbi:MAG: glycogen/starch/alpha-glucan phosphorylase, partial [Clostridiales Family XIII bacterium]|nr:glycogen/starch/alpha-glucan phosphorylase [Clostridiales Family XIII bacterium]
VAEHLIPATDVSEQLSTAGLEASGTGNMKFMMNGAVTIGTMDGANVEIHDSVGEDGIFIFGARVAEIEELGRTGAYNPLRLYEEDPDMKRVLDALVNGTLQPASGRQFQDLYNALLYGIQGKADKYYVLHDFASYNEVFARLCAAYEDQDRWQKMALANIVRSGMFSSDRTILEYAREIWHLEGMV